MQTPDEADRLLEMQRLGDTDSGNKETDEIEDWMLYVLKLLKKILSRKKK